MTEPLYLHIVRTITAQVQSGVLKPGDKLPSIPQLAAEFEVGLTTIKTALLILETTGVVRGVQGRGTYIASTDSA